MLWRICGPCDGQGDSSRDGSNDEASAAVDVRQGTEEVADNDARFRRTAAAVSPPRGWRPFKGSSRPRSAGSHNISREGEYGGSVCYAITALFNEK